MLISSDIAVKIEDVSKCYHIYDSPRDRLLQMFTRGRKKLFREFWALDNVSLEIRQGETVGIIGRNGSGKSTLLQIICGTLNPSAGTVQVNGRIAALLELGSGFNPEFTGRENVFLSAAVLGLSREEVNARFDDIATFADIGDFIDQPVKTYSSGMYVRLAFAVVAHVDADILVIDEALAVGDAFFTQKCMRFLRRFKETGTLIFVSHDAGTVTGLCEKALWLDRGCPKAYDSAKLVSEKYLASLYTSEQATAVDSASKDQRSVMSQEQTPRKKNSLVDARAALLKNSNLRNDLEIFEFTQGESAEFGQRAQHRLVGVRLHGVANQRLLAGEGLGEDAVVPLQRRRRIAIERRADGFRELNEIDRLGMQHTVAIVEMVHDTLVCLNMISSENRFALFRIMLQILVAEQRIEDEGPFIATRRGRRGIRAIGRIEHAGLRRPLAIGVARCRTRRSVRGRRQVKRSLAAAAAERQR